MDLTMKDKLFLHEAMKKIKGTFLEEALEEAKLI
jgi:myosin-crossreactive antigen